MKKTRGQKFRDIVSLTVVRLGILDEVCVRSSPRQVTGKTVRFYIRSASENDLSTDPQRCVHVLNIYKYGINPCTSLFTWFRFGGKKRYFKNNFLF